MWKKGFCYAQQSPKKAMFWAESSVYFTAKREDLSIAEKSKKALLFPSLHGMMLRAGSWIRDPQVFLAFRTIYAMINRND